MAASEHGSACECVIQNDWEDDDEECLDKWEHGNGVLQCSRPAGHDGPHAACNFTEHPVMIWSQGGDA